LCDTWRRRGGCLGRLMTLFSAPRGLEAGRSGGRLGCYICSGGLQAVLVGGGW